MIHPDYIEFENGNAYVKHIVPVGTFPDDQPKSVFYENQTKDDFLSFEDLNSVMQFHLTKTSETVFREFKEVTKKEKLSFPSCITN